MRFTSEGFTSVLFFVFLLFLSLLFFFQCKLEDSNRRVFKLDHGRNSVLMEISGGPKVKVTKHFAAIDNS